MVIFTSNTTQKKKIKKTFKKTEYLNSPFKVLKNLNFGK